MSFLAQENKGLIWTLLQDNNTFDGLTNDKFAFVQKKFEDILSHINIEYGNNGLLEKNKIAIEMSIDMINKEKKGIDKKIQMIYKAQDLEDERKSKLNEEYNQQKQQLDTMINPTKPKEINFNDNIKDDEDRPIGNDMDRLIAERMASRERELEIPEISEEAKKWLNNDNKINDNKINNNIETIKEEQREDRKEPKKVSFNDNNVNNIFDKLKKKTIEKEVREEIDFKKEYNLLLSKKNQMLLLFKEIEVSLNKLIEYKV
jgi:hypothetical protein